MKNVHHVIKLRGKRGGEGRVEQAVTHSPFDFDWGLMVACDQSILDSKLTSRRGTEGITVTPDMSSMCDEALG